MRVAAGFFEQAHAFGSAGDERALRVEPLLQSPAHAHQAGLVRDALAHDVTGLELVGRQDAHALVGFDVALLGVDADLQPACTRGRDRHVEHGARDDALAVVADDEAVAARQLALEHAQQPGERLAGDLGARLPVGAHHLLRVGDDARLHRRRPQRIAHDGARVHAARGERIEQLLRATILADEPHQHRLGAECGEVRSHVPGAAERAGFPLHLDHRHGRLGRDALAAAPQVVVEHQVAEHEQPAAGELVDDALQVIERERRGSHALQVRRRPREGQRPGRGRF